MADNAPLLDEGLSATEALRRLAEDGPNALPGGQPRTWLTIVWETARGLWAWGWTGQRGVVPASEKEGSTRCGFLSEIF